ncbi:MAG: hypothetical protein ABIH25_00470 [Candidatus Woesearchaeota archaeon]
MEKTRTTIIISLIILILATIATSLLNLPLITTLIIPIAFLIILVQSIKLIKRKDHKFGIPFLILSIITLILYIIYMCLLFTTIEGIPSIT